MTACSPLALPSTLRGTYEPTRCRSRVHAAIPHSSANKPASALRYESSLRGDAFPSPGAQQASLLCRPLSQNPPHQGRSEEHTSELQSHSDLVCRLLLEKK